MVFFLRIGKVLLTRHRNMAIFEIYHKDTRETPKVAIEAKTEEEAIAAYRAKWDKDDFNGDFKRECFYQVTTIWRKR